MALSLSTLESENTRRLELLQGSSDEEDDELTPPSTPYMGDAYGRDPGFTAGAAGIEETAVPESAAELEAFRQLDASYGPAADDASAGHYVEVVPEGEAAP